ncbi:type II toxin-antitoxin system RelE/ParE family toxin [Luteimonas sp. XNQY3]|nr:type II toxin-antitoxin system RelE/ParE family toxin [Luteimonas sp. XNQY3]MCD9007037.1 type II toxin-antitoxin system RelE/ParE family toxin [Luteimonas sp. XNQY3]
MKRWRRGLAKNADAAQRAVKATRGGVRVLAHQPHIGRPIDDLADAYREWLIDYGDSGYVARYRLDGETVTILAVRYQKEVGTDRAASGRVRLPGAIRRKSSAESTRIQQRHAE